MKHKSRSGQLVICYMCKQQRHSECVNDDDLYSEYVRCHCSCQPECERPACAVTKKLTPRPGTTKWKWDDPRWS